MAAVKQIKIGNTNYDLKALNAANQNQSGAVVRDIQYGTAAPTGGSAGQMYLQYINTDTENLYLYAEDTAADTTGVADKYYSKNEVDAMIANITDKITWHNYAWGGNTSSGQTVTITCSGPGFIIISAFIRANNSTDNYGLLATSISKSDNNGSSWNEISREEHRKHGSGYSIAPAAFASTGTSTSSATRFKIEFNRSYEGTHYWRIEVLSVGCTVTKL